MGPQLLGDLGRVALGHRPRAGRVHDQRALARHQPLVVRGVIPRRHIGRQERHQPLVVVERLAHGIALDRHIALGIDQHGAEAVEDHAGGVDIVGCRAEADAEGVTALVAGLGRLEEGVERPGVRLGRSACGIHRLHVDAGQVLHEVDARARPLDLAADGRRHAQPLAIDFAEIFDGAVHGAVLLDQRLHDVVHRHELVGVARRQPGREGEDVVARLGLRLGGSGQQQLVALRGDEVDVDLDLLLGRPLVDQSLGRIVGLGHPMVPQRQRELASRVGAAHERRDNEGRRCRCGAGDESPTCNLLR